MKAIALTNLQHAAALPDIPTGKEAGYKSLEFDGLVGLMGPRDMPFAVRERIAADIRTIAANRRLWRGSAPPAKSSIRDAGRVRQALADQPTPWWRSARRWGSRRRNRPGAGNGFLSLTDSGAVSIDASLKKLLAFLRA